MEERHHRDRALEKHFPMLTMLALKLSLVCFILAIVSKLGGFNLVASPRSFIALTVVGLLFAMNLTLLRLLGTKEE